ncbi:hypothetical protein JX266_012413 [Neoarthrinium moseri]|nr:hypothetical protein JX266_012413 [Neoarthrinium moseri]
MAFLVGASAPLAIQRLAIPASCLIVLFLGYGSQYLFAISPDLAPGPLTKTEKWIFNVLLFCQCWTYFKTCSVDPGRYTFPPSSSHEKQGEGKGRDTKAGEGSDDEDEEDEAAAGGSRQRPRRWCKKCRRPKPPRAHHCRTCARCIPKMDHHCPWTSNCVSLQTFPHFLRFLAYSNLAVWTLLYLLGRRFLALWEHRNLPAYLGPTHAQLAWLTVFSFLAGCAALAIGILFASTFQGWLFNTTMIEGWEIERHEAVLERRAGGNRDAGDDSYWRGSGGSDGDGGRELPPDAVEFPYDVGIFANMAAAMGTANPLLWLLPFAGHPTVAPNADGRQRGIGWEYEENGLNDAEGMWPPADPAKARHASVWRRRRREMLEEEQRRHAEAERWDGPEQHREAFRRRQERDLRRWEGRILGELEEVDDGGDDQDQGYDFVDEAYRAGDGGVPGRLQRGIVVDEGKKGWVNADGEHLGDYGVDEDAESDELDDVDMIPDEDDDDDDVPLGELIRRRKIRVNDGEYT